MKQKLRVNLTLDPDVYFAAKLQTENLSSTVNDLLGQFLSLTKIEGDEQQTQEDLDNLMRERNDIGQKIATKSAELAMIRQKNKERMKLQQEEAEAAYDSVRIFNPMNR